ncbi:hypothetical protein Tco_1159605 [Tanacetum coccineum]
MHGDALFYDNNNNKSMAGKDESEDPFNLYDILNKNKESDGISKKGELKYPPGFTPKEATIEDVQEKVMEVTVEKGSSWRFYIGLDERIGKGLGHKAKKGGSRSFARRIELILYLLRKPKWNVLSWLQLTTCGVILLMTMPLAVIRLFIISIYAPKKQSAAPRSQGSILNLMEDLIKVGHTMGYNMDGCLNNLTQIIESQGEASVFR